MRQNCSELLAMIGSMSKDSIDYFHDIKNPFEKKQESTAARDFERFLELSLAAPADDESAETKEQDAA